MVPLMVGVLFIPVKPAPLGEESVESKVCSHYIFSEKLGAFEVMLQHHTVFSSLGILSVWWPDTLMDSGADAGNERIHVDIFAPGSFWMMTIRVPDDDSGYCI